MCSGQQCVAAGLHTGLLTDASWSSRQLRICSHRGCRSWCMGHFDVHQVPAHTCCLGTSACHQHLGASSCPAPRGGHSSLSINPPPDSAGLHSQLYTCTQVGYTWSCTCVHEHPLTTCPRTCLAVPGVHLPPQAHAYCWPCQALLQPHYASMYTLKAAQQYQRWGHATAGAQHG
jgi:hypothetical protein